jgi:hypothetical protein
MVYHLFLFFIDFSNFLLSLDLAEKVQAASPAAAATLILPHRRSQG